MSAQRVSDLFGKELRFVPPGIHDTEETEGLIIWIPQLMRHPGFDIKSIKKLYMQFLLAHNTNASASDADDYMLVLVHFKAALAAGRDLEIPQVESGSFLPCCRSGSASQYQPSLCLMVYTVRVLYLPI